ncbi:helix-turn-helix transcriptional regulator [Stenotrophomonas sp. SORGH_AS_0321]|uniref:helix-turn-helix domain-containing protein n=1 Tax=Stenotrophomonas sp. SORGH_AS_0321 TaxID=3041787 RepID=UPI002858C46F|nr:helix-turn-helix transcriptional regulator [Stenotrophomonas sp. SORGH_AS_0321]MDR6094924.1 transcriptional regulator with XRE-family HTH domain [Stenotrophomonas sp. SORGH_AS_0321]
MNPSTAIESLRVSGMTEQAIGAKVGVGQSTINKIRRGLMQPTYPVGKALVDLATALDAKVKRDQRRGLGNQSMRVAPGEVPRAA